MSDTPTPKARTRVGGKKMDSTSTADIQAIQIEYARSIEIMKRQHQAEISDLTDIFQSKIDKKKQEIQETAAWEKKIYQMRIEEIKLTYERKIRDANPILEEQRKKYEAQLIEQRDNFMAQIEDIKQASQKDIEEVRAAGVEAYDKLQSMAEQHITYLQKQIEILQQKLSSYECSV